MKSKINYPERFDEIFKVTNAAIYYMEACKSDARKKTAKQAKKDLEYAIYRLQSTPEQYSNIRLNDVTRSYFSPRLSDNSIIMKFLNPNK